MDDGVSADATPLGKEAAVEAARPSDTTGKPVQRTPMLRPYVVNQLGLPAADIETLCGLPRGFLAEFAPVSVIHPNAPHDEDPSATPADVVRLPVGDSQG